MTDKTTHKPGCEALGGYGHGIGPCSCSEAQPEALYVAEQLDATRHAFGDDNAQSKRRASAELRRQHAELQQLKGQLTTQTNRAAAAEQQVTALTQRLDMANRLNTDARNQLAQLSARQAAPEETIRDALVRARDWFESQAKVVSKGCGSPWNLMQLRDERDAADAALSAAPPPPEREPQKHDENRELAETAMRFVDRAGDVHPGIDDADRICAEFHAAMMEVIEKWHPMPMPPGIGATND